MVALEYWGARSGPESNAPLLRLLFQPCLFIYQKQQNEIHNLLCKWGSFSEYFFCSLDMLFWDYQVTTLWHIYFSFNTSCCLLKETSFLCAVYSKAQRGIFLPPSSCLLSWFYTVILPVNDFFHCFTWEQFLPQALETYLRLGLISLWGYWAVSSDFRV